MARRLLDAIAVSLLALVVVGMADLCQTSQVQYLHTILQLSDNALLRFGHGDVGRCWVLRLLLTSLNTRLNDLGG